MQTEGKRWAKINCFKTVPPSFSVLFLSRTTHVFFSLLLYSIVWCVTCCGVFVCCALIRPVLRGREISALPPSACRSFLRTRWIMHTSSKLVSTSATLHSTLQTRKRDTHTHINVQTGRKRHRPRTAIGLTREERRWKRCSPMGREEQVARKRNVESGPTTWRGWRKQVSVVSSETTPLSVAAIIVFVASSTLSIGPSSATSTLTVIPTVRITSAASTTAPELHARLTSHVCLNCISIPSATSIVCRPPFITDLATCNSQQCTASIPPRKKNENPGQNSSARVQPPSANSTSATAEHAQNPRGDSSAATGLIGRSL